MDFTLLSQVVDELAPILSGAKVDKVVHGAEDSLLLVLHRIKSHYYLLLSPKRSLPRIHLISHKPSGTDTPAGFFLFLKKYLVGSRVGGIRLVDRDRIVEMHFRRPEGEYLLLFELTGSVTNILLTDGSHKILAVHHAVPPGDTVRRPLLPGLDYSPPLRKEGADRVTSRDAPVEILPAYTGNTPINAAVEAWYERVKQQKDADSLRRHLTSVVKKAAARTQRRIDAVAGDVAAAEKGDEYRIAGELLLANKHRLTKGQAHADLSGYDGISVHVILDPSQSPAENANRYFKRYKKAKAGLAMMRERLADAHDEAAFLATVQEELDAARDRESLLAVRAELARRRYVKDAADRSALKGRMDTPPFRSIEHEGWQILVGKSAAGNEYITLRLARPDDLWLHAEGMPGSHVIVKNPGKRDVPENILRRAASLAAYYSRGRGSTKVPVAYTPAAMVKKPKGAAPGAVVLIERKTIMAIPESG